jgi:hypothetical protein
MEIPDTTAYLIFGLVASAVLVLVQIVSVALRRRSLHRDLTLIEELARDER